MQRVAAQRSREGVPRIFVCFDGDAKSVDDPARAILTYIARESTPGGWTSALFVDEAAKPNATRPHTREIRITQAITRKARRSEDAINHFGMARTKYRNKTSVLVCRNEHKRSPTDTTKPVSDNS